MKKDYLKKRFHPFETHLYQNWWAKSMPVVAVLFSIRFESNCSSSHLLDDHGNFLCLLLFNS